MELEAIQKLIVDATGLESGVMGNAVVQRAVNFRMDQSGLNELRGYSAMLHQSDKERQALINEITVPETWFFRDKKPFEFLAEYAANELKNKIDSRPFRVLSLPCATGEEAYSIVMTLLAAGYSLEQFHVDAVDINTRVLRQAQEGCYGGHSFRGDVGDYQQHYFTKNKDKYKINEMLKTAISFIHGNVLDKSFISSLGYYDVIFCRNLLIYFDLKNRKKVLGHLHGRLHSEGRFFLGHSETGRGIDGFFESIKQSGTFAYKKIKNINDNEVFYIPKKIVKNKKIPPAKTSVVPFKKNKNSGINERPSLDSFLLRVEDLANRGDLTAAHVLSTKLIKQYPGEANVYFWLAVVCLGLALDDEAFEALRKALYLKPTHDQALVCLVRLAEQKGNNEAAKNYRTRLHRLRSGDV